MPAPGRVIADQTAREVLQADGVQPDFAAERRAPARPDDAPRLAGPAPGAPLDIDYIHRTGDGAEIYFVANRVTNAVSADCVFRVAGKAPELWNAVTGEHKFAAAYERERRTHHRAAGFRPVRLLVCRLPRTGSGASGHGQEQQRRR